MVAPSALVGSHLLFADDSLLFFRANVASAQEIKEILEIYCKASGHQVNMDKSPIHFANGVPQSTKGENNESTGCSQYVLERQLLWHAIRYRGLGKWRLQVLER